MIFPEICYISLHIDCRACDSMIELDRKVCGLTVNKSFYIYRVLLI